jgi:hypothetical protein
MLHASEHASEAAKAHAEAHGGQVKAAAQ